MAVLQVEQNVKGALSDTRVVRSFRKLIRKLWTHHQVLVMVLAALAGRLILVIFVFRDQTDPANSHAQFGWEMGWVSRSLALGHGFNSPFAPATGPTALVPPAFPYLLAAIFRIFGLYSLKSAFAILSINSLFSALTCVPLYLSARYALGEKAATFAGWLWVFYPYAIYFSSARVWDYALTAFLFTTCFYFAQRLHRQKKIFPWLGFGVLYGVTVLANPSVLTLFPVFLLLAAIQARRLGGPWLCHSLVAILGITATLTPWTVRNYRDLHVVRPIRDNYWLESWAGNNGDTSDSNPAWAHPASNPVEMQKFQAQGEVAYLSEKHTLASNFIRQHPLFTAGVSLRRALCFWTGFWSLNPTHLHNEPLEIPDVFYCTTLTLFMLIGMRSLWLIDVATALPYLLLLALFPLTYYFSHASPDYRQPIEPEIVVLVTLGARTLKRRWRSIARGRPSDSSKRFEKSIPTAA